MGGLSRRWKTERYGPLNALLDYKGFNASIMSRYTLGYETVTYSRHRIPSYSLRTRLRRLALHLKHGTCSDHMDATLMWAELISETWSRQHCLLVLGRTWNSPDSCRAQVCHIHVCRPQVSSKGSSHNMICAVALMYPWFCIAKTLHPWSPKLLRESAYGVDADCSSRAYHPGIASFTTTIGRKHAELLAFCCNTWCMIDTNNVLVIGNSQSEKCGTARDHLIFPVDVGSPYPRWRHGTYRWLRTAPALKRLVVSFNEWSTALIGFALNTTIITYIYIYMTSSSLSHMHVCVSLHLAMIQ